MIAKSADWDTEPPPEVELPPDDDDEEEEYVADPGESRRSRRQPPPPGHGGLTLNINIQLQLPNNADGKTYEQLFAAMGKHLKDLGGLG